MIVSDRSAPRSVVFAAVSHLEPGQFVRLPARPDWGCGQVQSVAGLRVTVNFENAGKVLVNVATAKLEVLDGRG